MIILVESYFGPSDFIFDVQCTGAFVSLPEVLARGIINRDIVRRHAKSSYVRDWYEVQPGDRIRIEWRDEVQDIEITFVVPEVLPEPPQSPDHESAGMRLYHYLERYCNRL